MRRSRTAVLGLNALRSRGDTRATSHEACGLDAHEGPRHLEDRPGMQAPRSRASWTHDICPLSGSAVIVFTDDCTSSVRRTNARLTHTSQYISR